MQPQTSAFGPNISQPSTRRRHHSNGTHQRRNCSNRSNVKTTRNVPFPITVKQVANIPNNNALQNGTRFRTNSFHNTILHLIYSGPLPSNKTSSLHQPIRSTYSLLNRRPMPIIIRIGTINIVRLPPIHNHHMRISNIPALIASRELLCKVWPIRKISKSVFNAKNSPM